MTNKTQTISFKYIDEQIKQAKKNRKLSIKQRLINRCKELGKAIEEGDPQTISDRWINLSDLINKIESENQ